MKLMNKIRNCYCFLIFAIFSCQNNSLRNESDWKVPNEIIGFWNLTKVEFARKGSNVIDSQELMHPLLEFDSISKDSFYLFAYPIDTSCYNLIRSEFKYNNGVCRSSGDTGTVVMKQDTLKLRWSNEFQSDPDVIFNLVKYTGVLPLPFCNK